MRIILALSAVIALMAGTARAEKIDEASVQVVIDAMRVPYSKIYAGSRCDRKLIAEVWYLRCHPSGDGVPGGVWAVVDGPSVVPVNGKALQHADHMGPIVDNNLRAIPIKKWTDVFPKTVADVGAVLKAFGQ